MQSRILLHIVSSILVISFLAGCAVTPTTPTPVAEPVPTITATPQVQPDFDAYFQEFSGAFVLYDLNTDQYIRYNPEACDVELLPASTFKILNSLIALETGVIPDENSTIKWDGTQYENAAWNSDQTMRTAIRYSVIWFYQELARRIGLERMQEYIHAVQYGNQNISGEIDTFWLVGGLRITANEQIEFLKKLYQNDLPFSQRSMDIVKDILVLDSSTEYILRGKTGGGQLDRQSFGWFVGYIEENNDVYFFATNISSRLSSDANGITAKEITVDILRDYRLLP